MVKSATLRLAVITAALACAVALAFASCGGRGRLQAAQRIGGLETAAPAETSINEELAELDALACPEGVDSALWAELKDALEAAFLSEEESRFSNRDFLSTESRLESRDSGVGDNHGRDARATRIVSTPPTGEANRVNDLAIADNGDGSYTLSWHYCNLGDYGQDGTVGISDITPIAQHFNETYDPETEPDCIQAVIDGSGNGKVGIEDVTPIAVHFGTECAAYSVRRSSAYPEEVGDTTELDTAPVEPEQWEERRVFSVDFALPPYTYIAVAPVDAEETPGDLSNVQYTPNHQPVAALTADPTEGNAPLTVNFDASGSHDPDGPMAKYEWDWEGDGVWDEDTGAAPVAQHLYELADHYYPAVRVTDSSGATATAEAEVWAGRWRISVVSDEVGGEPESTNLEVVNGHPAISFYGRMEGTTDDGFWYVRAEDPLGENWGSPVFVMEAYAMSSQYGDNSLAVVNGRPAIAGNDAFGTDLLYARAEDADGSAWGTPMKVSWGGLDENNVSLAMVNGKPAIGWSDVAVFYMRAQDPDGTAWGSPVIANPEGRHPYLAVVNGNPAISYIAPGGLWYVRANDAGGESWGEPVVVDAAGGDFPGNNSSLAVVNGRPAICYNESSNAEVRYVRANDPNGNTWGTPLAVAGGVWLESNGCSLIVINGRPAIACTDLTDNTLKYVCAADADGSSWRTPVTVDGEVMDADYFSLKSVNGCPAISYFAYGEGELRFAIYY